MKELLFDFPSGNTYNVVGEKNTQKFTFNGDQFTYEWQYSTETLKDEDDRMLGYGDPVSYKGCNTMFHRFFGGYSLVFDNHEECWLVSVRFSGFDNTSHPFKSLKDADALIAAIIQWNLDNVSAQSK